MTAPGPLREEEIARVIEQAAVDTLPAQTEGVVRRHDLYRIMATAISARLRPAACHECNAEAATRCAKCLHAAEDERDALRARAEEPERLQRHTSEVNAQVIDSNRALRADLARAQQKYKQYRDVWLERGFPVKDDAPDIEGTIVFLNTRALLLEEKLRQQGETLAACVEALIGVWREVVLTNRYLSAVGDYRCDDCGARWPDPETLPLDEPVEGGRCDVRAEWGGHIATLARVQALGPEGGGR